MNNFECPFSLYARHCPDAIALRGNDQTWTYQQCHAWTSGLVNRLREANIAAGDCVAFIPTKAFPTPLFFFALFRIGAIAFPLNSYLPKEGVKRLLAAARPALFLYNERLLFPELKLKTLSLTTFFRSVKPTAHALQPFLVKKHIATYLATSGTTKTPKIAALSIGNHYYSALGSNGALPSLHEQGRWLLSLPLYHVAGIAILFRTFLAGATLVLPSSSPLDPRFSAHEKISHLSLVPTQLYRLLDFPHNLVTSWLKHLRCVLLGGATISADLYHRASAQGLPLYPTYGMTEMGSQVTTATDRAVTFFSLGHPLPYRECKMNAEGEICVRGKTLFQGYLNEQKELHLPLDSEGYFATRDVGSYSLQKGLHVLGRKDRLFMSGGENIHPEEIERSLLSIQGIVDVCVTPVQDKEFGMRPIAYVTSTHPLEPRLLQERLAAELPRYKIPIDFLPMSQRMAEGNSAKSQVGKAEPPPN